MPTRLIRDGILSSDAINSLGWFEEVFYRRLMSVTDDYGLYDARPVILRSALFPLKIDKVREADIERGLAACEEAGLVRFYSVDGKRYLQIVKFGQQVKSKPKWPLPSDEIRNDSLQPVTARNESLPSVTKTESETKTNTDSKTETNIGENTAYSRKYPLPKSSDEVKAYLQAEVARGCLGLLEQQLIDLSILFFNDKEACGWVDAKGNPINNWKAAAMAYALRYAGNRRPTTTKSTSNHGGKTYGY